MNYLFISDIFYEDGHIGGAEIYNYELINKLKERNHNVTTIHSFFVSPEFLQSCIAGIDFVIIGNFLNVTQSSINFLIRNKIFYYIVEHDYKFLITRDPSVFLNDLAPKESIINREFYASAYKVVAQSLRHKSIIERNLELNNIVCGVNLWGEDQINNLKKFQNQEKIYDAAVMQHIFAQKGFIQAEQFCKQNKLNYLTIPYNTKHEEFCKNLASCRKLVFFPQVNETLSRVSVEAHCLSTEVIGNNNISFFDEPWSKLRGSELILFLEESREKTVQIFES